MDTESMTIDSVTPSTGLTRGAPANGQTPLLFEALPTVDQNQRIGLARAMTWVATTVLPNAVVAASTPVSWCSSASAAACCSNVSVPVKLVAIGRPTGRSSRQRTPIPSKVSRASA